VAVGIMVRIGTERKILQISGLVSWFVDKSFILFPLNPSN
jgi:hypothetical protein